MVACKTSRPLYSGEKSFDNDVVVYVAVDVVVLIVLLTAHPLIVDKELITWGSWGKS